MGGGLRPCNGHTEQGYDTQEHGKRKKSKLHLLSSFTVFGLPGSDHFTAARHCTIRPLHAPLLQGSCQLTTTWTFFHAPPTPDLRSLGEITQRWLRDPHDAMSVNKDYSWTQSR